LNNLFFNILELVCIHGVRFPMIVGHDIFSFQKRKLADTCVRCGHTIAVVINMFGLLDFLKNKKMVRNSLKLLST
jgi:hypothetical protein